MTYDRMQLEKTLPPLRLPKEGEDRNAFEREIDARLAALARLADVAPSECVGLALWLGSHDWKAFEVDLADVAGRPTETKFSRNLLIAAAEADTAEKKTGLKVAGKTIDWMRRLGIREPTTGEAEATEQESMHVEVRTYRSKRSKLPEEERDVRNPEMLAVYMRDEDKLPVEHVKRIRREQLQRELRWSAARLQSS